MLHFRRRLAAHVKICRNESNEDEGVEEASEEKVPKSRKKRKDKGTIKKSMATFLSNVDIGVEGEKILLSNAVSKIDASKIREEILEAPDVLKDFEDSEVDESALSGKICLQEFSNKRKMEQAHEKALKKFIRHCTPTHAANATNGHQSHYI